MAEPYTTKVRPGDRLRIRAETFNTLLDVIDQFRARQMTISRRMFREHIGTDYILVRNDTEEDLDRFSVLGIAGPLITPTDNLLEFQSRVLMSGVAPAPEHAGRFVVLLEPANAGEIVRARIDGPCPVLLRVSAPGATCAECAPPAVTHLVSTPSGSARVLWVAPPENGYPYTGWAVVRLAAGGSMAASFAMITSKAGTMPPYRYAAVQATMDGDGVWSQVEDGTAYNNVFNLEEQGAGGQWVNPLVEGDVVLIFASPDPGTDAFVCTRSHYRGTY